MTEKEFIAAWEGIKPSLMSHAMSLVSYNKEDAEDLVQEAFIKAFKAYREYNGTTKFKTWAFNVTTNKYIDEYRKKRVRSKINNRMPEVETSEIEYCFASNMSLGKFVSEDIERAIEKLDENCKVPFKLLIEGFSYDEIAEKLNKPSGTIKVRIFSARRKLWEILKDYDNFSDKYRKELNEKN